jgi:hypothetical protein
VDVTRTAKFHLRWNDFNRLFKEYYQSRNNGPLLNWQMSWSKKGDFGYLLEILIKLKTERSSYCFKSKESKRL